MYRKLFILIIIFSAFQSFGQKLNFENVNEVFVHLYNRDSAAFQKHLHEKTDNEFRNLILTYNYYWQGLISSNIDYNFAKATAITKFSLTNEPNADIKAGLLLMQLRMDLAQKNYWAIMVNASNLKSYFKNHALDKQNPYNTLLWSLYHCLASYASEMGFLYSTYLASWPDSDKQLGLNLLQEQCSNSSVFIATEARYFLGKIYFELEENAEIARNYFKLLMEQYPNNRIYKELYDSSLEQKNNNS